jgi:hypothetical protein
LNEFSTFLQETSLFDRQETLLPEEEEERENARSGVTQQLKNQIKQLYD